MLMCFGQQMDDSHEIIKDDCKGKEGLEISVLLVVTRKQGIWERFGRFPKLSTFKLQQHGRHLRFTDPVTSVETLAPVHFART